MNFKKEVRNLRKEWKNIIFNVIFAILAVLITSFFYKNNTLTTVLLIFLALAGLVKWKSSLATTIFIFGAIWGPVCEVIAIYFGAWSYSNPNLYNVPFWLFVLWGIAAAFLFETAKELKRLGVKDN